jgi:hypothetical protein
MDSSLRIVLAFLFCLLGPRQALAWDTSELVYLPADGEVPGGGGIVGTGSVSDGYARCVDCHVEPLQRIDLAITTDPPFEASAETRFYEPGQAYDVTVLMTGETLGLTGCQAGTTNNNMIAAAFEDLNGMRVGLLASDSGQAQGTSCPSTRPAPSSVTRGTTLLFGDCSVVLTRDELPGGTTQWMFRWTAPARGTGDVVLFAGGVDSNCNMTSLDDDAKMVSLTLSEGSLQARLSPNAAPTSERVALAAATPAVDGLTLWATIVGFVATFGLRKRRGNERVRSARR